MKGYKLIVISSVILFIYGVVSLFSVYVLGTTLLNSSPLLFWIILIQGITPVICSILGLIMGRDRRFTKIIFILSIIQLVVFYISLCFTYGQPVLTVVIGILWFLVAMVYFTGAKKNRREVLND